MVPSDLDRRRDDGDAATRGPVPSQNAYHHAPQPVQHAAMDGALLYRPFPDMQEFGGEDVSSQFEFWPLRL